MKKLKRIVTFLGYPKFADYPIGAIINPQERPQPKRRVFVVTTVVYDDSLTPMYSYGILEPNRYSSLEELKMKHPNLDCPILDHDHSLKIYSDEQVCAM